MNRNILVGTIVGFALLAGTIFYLTQSDGPRIKRQNIGGGEEQDIVLKEAPMLAERVKAGQLPPVQDRVPKVPVVIQPNEKIGKYGGTWHLAMRSQFDHGSLIRTIGYENLVRWNVQWTGIIPNIAQSYTVSADSKEFTFTLREGMKWSDGEPFTAEDIMFWYEDVFMREEFASQRPAWLTLDGEPVKVTRLDKNTVMFSFTKPNSLFISSLAQVAGAEPTSYPKHYLKQFHPKYNPDVETLIKESGAKSWAEFFESKFGRVNFIDTPNRWQHPEIPTLYAWVLTNEYGKVPEVTAVRNPYYWKTDTAGNQLPYIDHVSFKVVDDNTERLELAHLGGIDMQDRHIGNSFLGITATRKSLADNAEKGGYGFFETVFANMNTMAISFNLTHTDPVLRKIFQDKNFRIGMSYAIDRNEVIQKALGGLGKPYQLAPRPESPFYNERLATQYSEFDIAKANEHLDKAGLTKKDSAGYRLRPDGKRLVFTLEWGDLTILNLLQKYWKAVGVEMKIGNTTDRTKYYDQKAKNLHDAGTWVGDGGVDVVEDPRYYFPFSHESVYAIPWGYWYNNPKNPLTQEPPAAAREQVELYRQIKATSDPQKQQEFMKKILDIAADQFYAIGISLPDKGFGVVKKNFHNVPAVMPSAFTYPNPAPTNPSQYFFE